MTRLQESMDKTLDIAPYFHTLHTPPTPLPLPDHFDFPHQFSPNPWAMAAGLQLQDYLETLNPFAHDFHETLGKMFGVLVVRKTTGEIGYLAGFSGKIGERNHYKGFVPPIFDTLNPNGIYKIGEAALNALNSELIAFTNDPAFDKLIKDLKNMRLQHDQEVQKMQLRISQNRLIRNVQRTENAAHPSILKDIDQESKMEQMALKTYKKEFQKQLEPYLLQESIFEQKKEFLKSKRAEDSLALQIEIFKAYELNNALGETKNVFEIFNEAKNDLPPGGTGECTLPKMLNFAYLNNLHPVCFAEFWWGKSPIGEVRIHKSFYPACRAKCEPLLAFMLQGIPTNPHPLHSSSEKTKLIRIHFEDPHILVIEKPEGLLSVPGKIDLPSVQLWLQNEYPALPEILPVHRLDMATSGLMVIAKNLDVYKILQSLFLRRKVSKEYTALLSGHPKDDQGVVSLPLRVDLNHRPHQMVCYEHGKSATTEFKVIERHASKTRILFKPITGRTHQLRVHSAHPAGLNAPILGDDLYGTPSDRLYLHASSLRFEHPITKEILTFNSKPDF